MSNKMMSESYYKLRWNIQGLFDNLSIIRTELEGQLLSVPENSTSKREKLEIFIAQLKAIEDTVKNIKSDKISEIEQYFDHKFTEPNLIVLSFFQADTMDLFTKLKDHPFPNSKKFDFEPYLNLDAAAKVLAFIGDSAVDLAITHVLWEPNISSTGELTKKRSDIVSNKNLSKLCDKLNLFDYRISFVKDTDNANEKKIQHAKGTIIEALFGVLYIECGLDKVISSVVLLK